MKHHSQKSYQYPVIRPNSEDYVNESFDIEHSIEIDNISIKISIKYILSSEDIKRQITKKNASYVSVIRCKDTFYSKSIKTNDASDSIEINAGDLRGNVEIQSFVIAQNNVVIQSQSLNDDYRLFQTGQREDDAEQSNQFAYNQGDMIALTDSYLFAIDREYFKPLQSCIDINVDSALKGGDWSIDISENHLKINVSQKMKDLWTSLRLGEAGKSALINSLYFSAITFAIKSLKDDKDMVHSHKWAEIILAKINNKGINLEEEDYRITTQLLDYPLLSLDNISHEY